MLLEDPPSVGKVICLNLSVFFLGFNSLEGLLGKEALGLTGHCQEDGYDEDQSGYWLRNEKGMIKKGV